MAIDHGNTITRGFLFADLRGYTDFVEQRGAAAAAALLTQYRALARDAMPGDSALIKQQDFGVPQ